MIFISAYPRKEFPDQITIYFTRPIGKDPCEKSEYYTNLIQKKFQYPIYVTKIFSDQQEYLFQKNFKNISTLPWSQKCDSEDDTFPEQIIDVNLTNKFIKEKTISKSSLRNFQKANSLYGEENVKILDTEICKDDCVKLIKNFFTQEKVKRKNLSSIEDYANMIFYPSTQKKIISKVFFINNIPAAFIFFEI